MVRFPGLAAAPRWAVLVAVAVVVAACSATATPAPTTQPERTDPPIVLTAPAEAAAGSTFTVGWTGAETSGDFLVVVPAGATEWTESTDSPYVNATQGNPATLTAPKAAGKYEIWFLKGDTEGIQIVKARSPLTVN